MEITEVRIKLMEEPGERLKAFCSITFDNAFVIRDLKIIEGTSGPFVAMPSRKLTSHCQCCGCKNHLRAGYCNQCGKKLSEGLVERDDDGRTKLYADIAHPINSSCRELIQQRVVEAYEKEETQSQTPGYTSSYDDFDLPSPVEAPSGIEPTQIQGAQRPRGPHTPPSQQGKPVSVNDFGEGIFE